MKHRELRKIIKKFRRKKIRQKKAQDRDKILEKEEELKLNDSKYQVWLKEQETLKKFQQENEEFQLNLAEKEWLEREEEAQIRYKYVQEKRKRSLEAEKLQIEKIQNEFKELQKFEKQKEEEKKRLQKEKMRKHENLLIKLKTFAEGKGEIPEELKENIESNPGKELCAFFTKTAACRHQFCNKNHVKPGISRIILLRNFFQHILLNEIKNTEYGNDILLEITDSELNKDYAEFFNDIIEELEKYGKIYNIRTAKNSLSHLRGNVYIEYDNEKSAMKAYLNLQGRFYASRQINVEFCSLLSWKSAICGLSFSKNCIKGKLCNYIHILKNPGDKYNRHLKHDDLSEIKNKTEKLASRSWNDIDEVPDKRNWRWSETPDKECYKNSNENQNKTTRKRKNNDEKTSYSNSIEKNSKKNTNLIDNVQSNEKLYLKHKKRKKEKSKRSSPDKRQSYHMSSSLKSKKKHPKKRKHKKSKKNKSRSKD